MTLLDLIAGGYNGPGGGSNLFGSGSNLFGGGSNLFGSGFGDGSMGGGSFGGGGSMGSNLFGPGGWDMNSLTALLNSPQGQNLKASMNTGGESGGGGLDSLQSRQGGMWTPQGWIPGSPWQTDTPNTPIFNSRPLAPVRPFGAVY